jgi:hypothetical protein
MVVRYFFPQPDNEPLMEQVELFFEYNAITDAAETDPGPEQTTNDDDITEGGTSWWRIEEGSNIPVKIPTQTDGISNNYNLRILRASWFLPSTNLLTNSFADKPIWTRADVGLLSVVVILRLMNPSFIAYTAKSEIIAISQILHDP